MREELVSIVMATYNGEKYIEEQLDSILSQTYKNIEIIIYDDASTDFTAHILRKYKNKFPLNLSLGHRNLGYTGSFEKALSLARGKWIALADQDDIWNVNKIEKLVQFIGDYSLIYSDMAIANQKGEIIINSKSKGLFTGYRSSYQLKYLLFKNSIAGCTMLINRDVLKHALPFPECCIHDHWLAIVACKLNGILFYDEPLLKYRLHEKSSIGIIRTSFLRDIRRIIGAPESDHRKYLFRNRLKWLTILMSHPLFDESDKVWINKVIELYKSYLEATVLPIRYYWLSLRYWRFLHSTNLYVYLKLRLMKWKS
jgi:glycosyltransferase involved in cell wall biosynthesis